MTVYIVLGLDIDGQGGVLHVFGARDLANSYGEKHGWHIGNLHLSIEEYEVKGYTRQHRCPCEA